LQFFFLLHLPSQYPLPAFRMPVPRYLRVYQRPRMSVSTSILGRPHRQGLSSMKEITGEEEAIIEGITTDMDILVITTDMDTGGILTTDLTTSGTGMVIEQAVVFHRSSPCNGIPPLPENVPKRAVSFDNEQDCGGGRGPLA
jgi:hypothetical protein